MIFLQITLKIEPMQVLSFVGLLMNVVIFVIMYKKYAKSTVNQDDLKDLKAYVDKQDRGLHHRLDEQKEDWTAAVNRIESKTDTILTHLLDKGK